jgi:putative transposase
LTQRSQFTGTAFASALIREEIAISMDGQRSRCVAGQRGRDNVFVERFWRSIKYEEVCLRAYDCVSDAHASIGRYLTFYNGRRPLTALDRRKPDQAYFNPMPLCAA